MATSQDEVLNDVDLVIRLLNSLPKEQRWSWLRLLRRYSAGFWTALKGRHRYLSALAKRTQSP